MGLTAPPGTRAPARLIPLTARINLALALVALLAGCTGAPDLLHVAWPADDPTRVVAQDGVVEGLSSVHILTLGVVETDKSTYGLVTPAVVQVKANGTGHVLIQSPYGVADDTKQSVLDAARAAAYVAGVEARAFDYTVLLDKDAGPMSGPSAGSQFALGFYVALNNLLDPGHPLSIADHYAGTGTISSDGDIGLVGGVPYKAQAAAKDATQLFVYPDGPVYTDTATSQHPAQVDMGTTCDRLVLTCETVGTLASLIDVATTPAPAAANAAAGLLH
jgi:predicted S18 family serine protease